MTLLLEVSFQLSRVFDDHLLRVERVGRIHGDRLVARGPANRRPANGSPSGTGPRARRISAMCSDYVKYPQTERGFTFAKRALVAQHVSQCPLGGVIAAHPVDPNPRRC